MRRVLSCTTETNVSSQNMYDTLLPLFSGGKSHVEPNEACIQPMQVSNNSIHHSITDANLHDALNGERTKVEESRAMSKWLVQTLCDSKLDAPLPSHTHYDSQHVSYARDCFALF